jgi:arylsulfatase A-like enzyme
MNFQSVSVGQKLAVSGPTDPPGLIGGYLDANATPNNAMVLQLAYVDTAIGQMVTELKNQGLSGSTLIIVSAKHGQSPIDLTLRTTRDDSQYFPQAPAYAFEIADDEVLFWMVPSEQTTQRPATWSYLQSVAQPANVQQWYDAETLQGTYKNPLTDPRTPDFIGVAVHGTIYTTGTKLAEHGGFADDDRHVALVVSGTTVPQGDAVNDPILTTQIAPTILRALGLNPHLLDGVRLEKTEALPDLGL